MRQTTIKSQINKELAIMPVKLQRKVLDFVIHLSHTLSPQKKDGEKLVKLAGLISIEDAEELSEIIKTDCEIIDNDW